MRAVRDDAARHFTATEEGIAQPPPRAWGTQRSADQIGSDHAAQCATESRKESHAAAEGGMRKSKRERLSPPMRAMLDNVAGEYARLAEEHRQALRVLSSMRRLVANSLSMELLQQALAVQRQAVDLNRRLLALERACREILNGEEPLADEKVIPFRKRDASPDVRDDPA
jgi:hypothetical protein